MNKIVLIIIALVVIVAIIGLYFILSGPKSQPQTDNKTGVVRSFDLQGMKVEVLREGSGSSEAKDGNTVTVHYIGTLTDGTKFDSSIDRREPFSFVLGEGKVIKGWDLGLVGMKIGEKRKLTIPANLAYGSASFGKIPANSTLIFIVEMMKIMLPKPFAEPSGK